MSAGARQTLSITLPWPDKALSPNGPKASMWPAVKARKAYRELAWGLWLQERTHDGFPPRDPTLTGPVVADITFTFTRKRSWDEDNHIAMLKSVWDAAMDAGVIVDDNADVFSIGTVKFERGKERGVTVTLREAR